MLAAAAAKEESKKRKMGEAEGEGYEVDETAKAKKQNNTKETVDRWAPLYRCDSTQTPLTVHTHTHTPRMQAKEPAELPIWEEPEGELQSSKVDAIGTRGSSTRRAKPSLPTRSARLTFSLFLTNRRTAH
jgi:hypothetical protein